MELTLAHGVLLRVGRSAPICISHPAAYTVKGSGWHRNKVRKHEDGRDMTRLEAKQPLEAERGAFLPTTPKHRDVFFAGDRRTVRELRRVLKLPLLKYPKRPVP